MPRMLDFLTLNPEAFGLEISDSFLRLIKLKREAKKALNLASWGEQELSPGIIDKGELKDEKEFLAALRKLLKNAKGETLKTNHVIISLGEEMAFLQTITLPEMEKEFLEKAVYFEAENYIPLKKEETCMDFEVISNREVLVTAYPENIITPFLSCLKEAGLAVRALEIESQAIARSLIKDGEEFIIIDMQKEKVVVLVYSQGAIRFTSTFDKKDNKLVEKIERSLFYCKKENPKIILNKELSFKDELTSRDLSVEVANPWINVPFKQVPKISFEESLNYSVAIGLALRGIQKYD